MDKNKSIWEEIVSFKMEPCIENYKNVSNEDRRMVRRIIENGASLEVLANNKKIGKNNDLYNIIQVGLITFSLSVASLLTIFTLFHICSNALERSILVVFLSVLVAYFFKIYQCKYLLNEFNIIDEIDDAEEIRKNDEKEMLRMKKVACNLYLK